MATKKRASRLPDDALDAYTKPQGPEAAEDEQGERARMPRERRKTAKLTVTLDQTLYDRARGAADALAGPPERLTLAELTRRGLENELALLEAEHNDGKPFDPPAGELRRGRRTGG